MRRFNLNKGEKGDDARDNMRLQEKLIEKYFEKLDLDEVRADEENAGFDSRKVYANITNTIDEPTVTVKPSYSRWLVAASVIAVFVFLSWFNRNNILNYLSPINMLEVAAANGNVTHITLGDGTKIWLNSGSKLKYPERFRGSLREITIEGEAFFDVAHDADHPFIVHTGDISTHVLGTSFNVQAYADEDLLKVDVVSGKVGVVPAKSAALEFETVFLTPSQAVVYDKRKQTITRSANIDISTVSAWKENRLVFKNVPLNDVLKTLSRKFNYEIDADNNLSRCFISADFTNVPFKDIMAVMAKLVKGKAVVKGSRYHLQGKGC
ncbi:iron dicitrate transport regulator FecR [Mucilaginibacter hurinus]|uniref:Iron dicitrate transport regulator FecR n=1 Tax=Mucilaginibacter hurinus TaxID=2201324 RepID=A0A367GPT9_9SPHI|nr:FecR family protein [Mucilaginibacter hurinus]RCH55300.1 iron dicitrate transport regulator FecR [Mucilaginibacter hurinus]